MAKELVRRGAMNSGHHSPLCVAAMMPQLHVVRNFLRQYQRRGQSELERALSHPCLEGGQSYSLLGHVATRRCLDDSEPHVAMARYLVQEWGVDVLKPTIVNTVAEREYIFMPVHVAASQGALAMLTFSINECGMPVDIQSPTAHFTPLHLACTSAFEEADILPLVRYLVEEKGADVTLKTSLGETAADIAIKKGRQQVYNLLARKEEELAARRTAEALAAVRLAEETRAADIAAQALMEELAAEEEAEEAKKQAKKGKKSKAKSKRRQGGKGGSAAGDSGGGGAASAAAAAAVGLSVASLTAATDGLAIGENEEEKAPEKKREENSHLKANPPALAAATDALPSFPPSGNDDDEEEDEAEAEDKEEAFQTFLLEDAPLSFHCPIGICLLTDPINAADGHTYQRAELERWIETCRVKQQPLTSPMTKEPMASMFFPAHLIKSQVGEYIDQRRQEWVAKRGKKKGGK